MNVLILRDYTDTDLKRNVKAGEILNVTSERAFILELKEVGKKIEEEVEFVKAKTTPRKKRK